MKLLIDSTQRLFIWDSRNAFQNLQGKAGKMKTAKARLIAAMIGFVGGGVASIIIWGLIISTFSLNYESIWPGVLIGAFFSAIMTLFFPRLVVILAEFIDLQL